MIIHWRAHLNSVQNAVGYMIKPTMVQFFSTPTASVVVDSAIYSATEIKTSYRAQEIQSSYSANEKKTTYRARTDEERN